MRVIFHASYLMGALLILGETFRRGLAYWEVHATTIIEDYISGVFLIIAAVLWAKKSPRARLVMAAAWAHMIGMMMGTSFSHLEAYLRGATRISDQPFDDVGSVIMKLLLWLAAVIGLAVTLASSDATQKLKDRGENS